MVINMSELKGTHTYDNLMKAFEGEAKAHLKYQIYKSKMANLSKEFEEELEEIIHNEKEHGKIWFKYLHQGSVPSDIENMKDAMMGESYEYSEMYPEFARIAREEGFEDIAEAFENVGVIEGTHRDKFYEMLNNIKQEKLFKDNDFHYWKCKNCGHIIYDKEAPLICPVCAHSQKYFVRDD